jgi:hypothetical protein
MGNETWKDVVGYEGVYKVSSEGRVRSIDRTIRYSRSGKEMTMRVRGCVMKQFYSHNGYLRIELKSDGKGNKYPVHRLVLEAFGGTVPSKPQVNHKNLIKDDNRIENLEWCDASENMQHYFRETGAHGPRGEICGSSILKECQVLEARSLNRDGSTIRELATKYGVTYYCMHSVIRRRTWKHI